MTEIHWINEALIGHNILGTIARPRGNDWLEDEVKWFKRQNVDYIISLLESSEIWELGLQDEKKYCNQEKIEYLNFPIKDRHTPDKYEFIKLSKKISGLVREGKKIAIHCRMGIGRASLLTASVMITLGFKGENVFDIIGKYRGLQVPDTQSQKIWLLSIEEELNDSGQQVSKNPFR